MWLVVRLSGCRIVHATSLSKALGPSAQTWHYLGAETSASHYGSHYDVCTRFYISVIPLGLQANVMEPQTKRTVFSACLVVLVLAIIGGAIGIALTRRSDTFDVLSSSCILFRMSPRLRIWFTCDLGHASAARFKTKLAYFAFSTKRQASGFIPPRVAYRVPASKAKHFFYGEMLSPKHRPVCCHAVTTTTPLWGWTCPTRSASMAQTGALLFQVCPSPCAG